MIYFAITAGVVALVGLLALFGWYRHKLELEGLHIPRWCGERASEGVRNNV